MAFTVWPGGTCVAWCDVDLPRVGTCLFAVKTSLEPATTAFPIGAASFGVSKVSALAIGKERCSAAAAAAAAGGGLLGDTCFTPSYVPPPTTTPAATTAATFAATPPRAIVEAPAPAPLVVAPTAATPPAPVAAEALCAPLQCAIVNGSGYTPVRRKVVVQEGPWVEVALPGASTKAPR